MKKSSQIVNLDAIIKPISNDINELETNSKEIHMENNNESINVANLLARVQALANKMNLPIETSEYLVEENMLNCQVDDYLFTNTKFIEEKISKFPKLTTQDTIVCILIGTLSIIIDVIFVGTPDVVKLYKGGEKFDGSIFTSVFRNIGKNENDPTLKIFNWLSDKCKVPYDISTKKGVLNPNNHRLRSLAHDPYFGLMFAVVDILQNSTTCINNNGLLQILLNTKESSFTTKMLSVIYYFGHIISDINTTRGIPVPGFFLTQFFTDGESKDSVARIAENMYLNGYDFRHLASMSVPVYVKDMLLDLYLKMNEGNQDIIISIAEREKHEIDSNLKKFKMKFICNLISTTGNTVKFLAPPSCGNPNSINIVQWMEFIKSSITILLATTRDITAEEVISNRVNIDSMWNELFLTKE